MLDIDHFKKTNDELVVRWGGEEFLIVLKQILWPEALTVGEKIRERVASKSFAINEQGEPTIGKTISIGISSLPFFLSDKMNITFAQVIELADVALYNAKSRGRNQVVAVHPGPHILKMENPVLWSWPRERMIEEGVIELLP